jgi:hypothetical protein
MPFTSNSPFPQEKLKRRPRDVRLRLLRAGFAPIPVEGKRPPMPEWQKHTTTNPDEIRLWDKAWHLATNTGILTRLAPTIDIDIADEAAAEAVEALAREHFEERGNILVRVGKAPKRAIPLRTDAPFPKQARSLRAPNGTEHKIEILCDGQQVVVFGIHPETRRPYSWHGGEPGETKCEDLPYCNADHAKGFLDAVVALLVAEFGYSAAANRPERKAEGGNGQGGHADWGYLIANIQAGRELHDSSTVLAAKLLRSGMGAGAVVNYLRAAFEASSAPKDERWQARYDDIPRDVESARKKLCDKPDEAILPGADAQAALDDTARTFNGHAKEAAPFDSGPVFDPWAQYQVPEFPLAVLPSAGLDFVCGQSAVTGCDPSALAMAMLTAFSGALDHRFAVKMMRNGNWWEHPRLWTLLVGDSSRKKTPMINAATRPLEHQQNVLRLDYEARLRDYEATKDDKDNQAEKPDPPLRHVVWDVTIEKLGEILSRGERGLLVKRDEFAGWIGAMEKYGGTSRGAGADRGFWLQAFDGGPYTVDRIGRGEIYIRNLSVSLLGGIQPKKLAELHGLTSDGLLQRFIPVMVGPPRLPKDRAFDDESYIRLMHSLIAARPRRFIFADDALEVMSNLREHLYELEQVSGGMAEGFQAFVGKLAGLSGSLAVILHMAADPEGNAGRDIEWITATHVRDLVLGFLLPHALEFYRTAEGATNGDRLRKLASWLLTSGKRRVVASDLTRNVADFRGLTLFDLNQHVSPLVAAGWLNPIEPKLGPANRAWDVNPSLSHQFADRVKLEDQRKAKLALLMGSSRKGKTQ